MRKKLGATFRGLRMKVEELKVGINKQKQKRNKVVIKKYKKVINCAVARFFKKHEKIKIKADFTDFRQEARLFLFGKKGRDALRAKIKAKRATYLGKVLDLDYP